MSMIITTALQYIKDGLRIGSANNVAYYEQYFVKQSGLKIGYEIKIIDIPLNENEYLHTAVFGNESAPVLILLHGYGGSFITFYRFFKYLAPMFRVYAIDNPGTGLSSRHDFNCNSNQEAIQYFTQRVEMLRKVLGIEQFYLAGHSFGGYISFFYTLQYPSRVKALFLISPAGFCDLSQSCHKRGFVTMSVAKKGFSLMSKLNITAGRLAQVFGKTSKIFFRNFVKIRLGLRGRENNLFTDYLYEMNKLKISSDNSLHKVLYMGAYSKNPIYNHIEEFIALGKKVFIYYGDDDWMDQSMTIVASNKFPHSIKMRIISKANHQLILQNPGELGKRFEEDFQSIFMDERYKDN